MTTRTDTCGYVARKADGTFLGQTAAIRFRVFAADELRRAQNLLIEAGGGVVYEATRDVLNTSDGPTHGQTCHGRPICHVRAGTLDAVRPVTDLDLARVDSLRALIDAEEEIIRGAQERIGRLRAEARAAAWWAA